MRRQWPFFQPDLRLTVKRHPRAWLAAGLIAAILAASGAVWLAASPARGTPPGQLPTATATERWTLLDLAGHIDAGEIKAVTVGVAESGARILLAQRQDDAYVTITSGGSIGDGA